MGEIAKASIDKILRKVGAERVSRDASKRFSEIIEDIALSIAKEAVALSKHTGRKTVGAIDIKIAKKNLRYEK